MSKPRMTPREVMQTLGRGGFYTFSSTQQQAIFANFLTRITLVKVGKRHTPTSGISFRFGNKPGKYMPHQGRREMERRIRHGS